MATDGARRAGWWRRVLAIPGLWRDRVDWKYGVDTSGEIQPEELRVDAPNAAFGYCYRAALGWVIRLFIRRLPVDVRDYAFVDFGSGKGRALLVASEFGFAGITGIEFSPALHAQAVENIALLGDPRVTAVLGDATDYDLPKRNLVCYLYNPFGPPVLDAVLRKLVEHHLVGYEVYVIYINPRHLDAVKKTGWFQPVFSHRKGVTLKVVTPGGARHG